MLSSYVPLPRHQSVGNLGRLIKTIAKSRKLKTEDVQVVIADLHQYAVGEMEKGNTIQIPPRKLKHPPPPRFERRLNSAPNTFLQDTR